MTDGYPSKLPDPAIMLCSRMRFSVDGVTNVLKRELDWFAIDIESDG
jgi:hypothetical protein